ncbi:MAG: DUF4093 domain-containing protein [Clostridia bacterium]|nr:DUF4093 domain-containing protein [Clostridia bacterium]
MQKPRINMPIIVEGKYDKNALMQIFDATVIAVGGFGIFNSKEKQALIRKISKDGVILLTDSDGGGTQIRSFLKGIIPKEKIFNAYVPMIKGKEKRKAKPSKAGLLGVEGVGREVLEHTLAPFVSDGGRANFCVKKSNKMITKVDFYLDKLSGADNAAARRDALAVYFELPTAMTAPALLEALNIITDLDGYKAAVSELFGDGERLTT